MDIQVPSEEQLQDTYTKSYRMQTVGPDGNTIRTSVPRAVVEKEAKRHSLSVRNFVRKFNVEWRYNSFAGAHALFVPIEKEKKDVSKEPEQMAETSP